MRKVKLPIVVAVGAGLAGVGVGLCVLGGGLGPPPWANAQGEGPTLLLFSEEDFGGRCLVVTGSLFELPKEVTEEGCAFDWNDNVRSLRVLSGTWRLCQHARLNTLLDDEPLSDVELSKKFRAKGWSCLVSAGADGPAEHRSAEGWGWVPEISSVELLSSEPLPEWARRALPGQ
ncbi:MAG: beta/gamma crystallin-related protein [Planctomycetota bacterium]